MLCCLVGRGHAVVWRTLWLTRSFCLVHRTMPSSLLVCSNFPTRLVASECRPVRLAEGFVAVGPGPLVDCFGTAFSRWLWLFGLLVARADFPVLLIRLVQLNFVAGVVDICALPPGARADSLHGPFNCLATKISFAEIPVASVFPSRSVRSVRVPVLSVSPPWCRSVEKEMKKSR